MTTPTTSSPTRAAPRTPLEAMRRRSFLRSSWPWRSVGYVVTTLLAGGVAALLLWPLVLPLVMTVLIRIEDQDSSALEPWLMVVLPLLGLALVAGIGPLVAIPGAIVERWRLQLVHPPVRDAHRTPRSGLWAWLRTRYTEPATWRELGYLLLLCTVLAPVSYGALFLLLLLGLAFVTAPLLVSIDEPIALTWWQVSEVGEALFLVPVGVLLLALLPYAAGLVAHGSAVLGRVLLGGRDTERLRAELVEVTRSRARLVDAFEAERRRIERDLHDGAQQRLVALAMQLGLARMDAAPGTQEEQALSTAHEQAKRLIGEMRELIHGIHPQLLVDRGLPAALPDLADRSVVPVEVRVDVFGRLPSHIEAAAYFVAAEALTNIAKHSGARQAHLVAEMDGDTLVLEVEDDGHGGADATNGTGLTGLADRVAVMDGRMLLSSPAGGPTRLRVELPRDPDAPRPA